MLSVLFKILLILGILILSVILIILFLPITYKVQGKIEDPSQKEADVKVNWLLGMLRFRLRYSTELSWQLKLLWFNLTPLLQGSKNKPKVSKSGKATVKSTSGNLKADAPPVILNETPIVDDGLEAPKKSLGDKINDIKEKINNIWQKVSYYINLLQEDDTKQLIAHILKALGKILKNIRPRKLKINAVFGFESPDTTGKIYGLTCMLYPYYGKDIHIIPDFERSVIQGSIYIRGCIVIIVLVINALKILFDRKLFKVIHKFKNGGTKKNGR